MNSEPFTFTIPTRGGELRVNRVADQCSIELWAVYPGRALMRGGFTVAQQDLRVLLHGLKYVVWRSDRDDWRRRNSEDAAA
jgi:hypothetical protein